MLIMLIILEFFYINYFCNRRSKDFLLSMFTFKTVCLLKLKYFSVRPFDRTSTIKTAPIKNGLYSVYKNILTYGSVFS